MHNTSHTPLTDSYYNVEVGISRYVSGAIELILGIIICVGNGAVMFIFGRNGQFRLSQNFFIIQLALADFMLGITMPFITATMVYPKMLRDVHLCILRYASPLLSMATSIFSLLILTLDRYLAIHIPLVYSNSLTTIQRATVSIAIWGVSITSTVIPFFIWNEGWSRSEIGHCDLVLICKDAFCIYFMPGCFFMTSGLILAMYARILFTAVRQANAIHHQEPGTRGKMSHIRKEMKAVKTVAMVLCVFFACWLPFILTLISQVLVGKRYDDTVTIIRTFSVLPAHMNSLMNPIIYAFRMELFRTQIKKWFCTKTHMRESLTSQT